MVENIAVKEIALRSVKSALLLEIDQLIVALKRLKPDQTGTTTQLLAHSEIEVLNHVKDIVDNLEVK